MTQPTYAPIPAEDVVRPGYRLAPPATWTPMRPGELLPVSPPSARGRAAASAGRGSPGPDQGYALRLARRFEDRLVLEAGERRDDVVAGTVAIAMRRAALFGRAPVAADLEVALGLFGFLAPAPPALVERRRALFAGISHDEWHQRTLVNGVAEGALRREPSEVASQPPTDADLASV